MAKETGARLQEVAGHVARVEKMAVPPRPLDNILLEATRSGWNKDLPTFSVTQILDVPADRELMLPLMQKLSPQGPLASRGPEPMQVLHASRSLIVPDYKIEGYVTQDSSKMPFIEMERLARAIETEAVEAELKALAKVKNRTGVTQAMVEETSEETKERIRQLVGTGHEIKKTYRVGNIQATEVIPQRRIDPLYCARVSDHKLDGSMNQLFESAFVKAMAGRIRGNEKAIQQAVKLGEVAGRTALNSCYGGARWCLAELLFVSEIVYSDGQYLANGFARLSL